MGEYGNILGVVKTEGMQTQANNSTTSSSVPSTNISDTITKETNNNFIPPISISPTLSLDVGLVSPSTSPTKLSTLKKSPRKEAARKTSLKKKIETRNIPLNGETVPVFNLDASSNQNEDLPQPEFVFKPEETAKLSFIDTKKVSENIVFGATESNPASTSVPSLQNSTPNNIGNAQNISQKLPQYVPPPEQRSKLRAPRGLEARSQAHNANHAPSLPVPSLNPLPPTTSDDNSDNEADGSPSMTNAKRSKRKKDQAFSSGVDQVIFFVILLLSYFDADDFAKTFSKSDF